jgi:hypothetical protein
VTTIKQLADQRGVKVTDVKQVLRKAFAGNEFKSPDYSLSPTEVAAVMEGLPAQLAARRAAPRDVAVERIAVPLLGCDGVPISASTASPAMPQAGGRVRLLLHGDVIDFLESGRGEDRPRQAAVQRLLRGMLVEGRAQRSVKGTVGVNRGWLRAPIGDNGGSHYYLWHALAGTPCVAALALGRDEVVVRAIRHHDDTKVAISVGAREDYVVLDASDYVSQVEAGTKAADSLSDPQRQAFDAGSSVTITKGHPGAGKTTLQLERTRRHAGRILFQTFGAAQCAQGRRWLETYAPRGQVARALTHGEVLAALAPGLPVAPPLEQAVRYLRRALAHEPRLGPWRDRWTALHAELRPGTGGGRCRSTSAGSTRSARPRPTTTSSAATGGDGTGPCRPMGSTRWSWRRARCRRRTARTCSATSRAPGRWRRRSSAGPISQRSSATSRRSSSTRSRT